MSNNNEIEIEEKLINGDDDLDYSLYSSKTLELVRENALLQQRNVDIEAKYEQLSRDYESARMEVIRASLERKITVGTEISVLFDFFQDQQRRSMRRVDQLEHQIKHELNKVLKVVHKLGEDFDNRIRRLESEPIEMEISKSNDGDEDNDDLEKDADELQVE